MSTAEQLQQERQKYGISPHGLDIGSIVSSKLQAFKDAWTEKPEALLTDYAKNRIANPPITLSRGDLKVRIYPEDIQELKDVLFSEVGNRNSEKKNLEVGVILNTIINRMAERKRLGKPSSLNDVLHEPNQYQGYQDKQYVLAKSPEKMNILDKRKHKEVSSIIDSVLKPEMKDTTGGAYYYSHDKKTGKIYYDNTRRLFE